MDIKKRSGRLSITTSSGESKMEVRGSSADILFNWLVMTSQVCKVLGIPVDELIRDLPAVIRDYETLVFRGSIAIRALDRKGGNYENGPAGKHPAD